MPTRPMHAAAESHLARVDPVLGAVIRKVGPCRLGATAADPFHVLCTSVISQQLSTKAADTIQRRVQDLLEAEPYLAPAHFHGVRHARLRGCGLSNAKATWLREIARRVRTGEFSFGVLQSLDDEAAIEMLDALPGIGRWSAEMYLIFALGRLDIFAMDDVGLRRGVDRLYGKGRALSDRRTLAITRPWAPYRSIASWYLWRLSDPS
ncbi:MAG TPA: DNA-3-methyladenine glycosylase 2 family protein [Candidatus Binatia bacterium]|nr:DNA-3-methyladenine glycosylase 2 family protein [Candidatus Binatia bacterium]